MTERDCLGLDTAQAVKSPCQTWITTLQSTALNIRCSLLSNGSLMVRPLVTPALSTHDRKLVSLRHAYLQNSEVGPV